MNNREVSNPPHGPSDDRDHVATGLGPWRDTDEPPRVPQRPARPAKPPSARPQPSATPVVATARSPRPALPLLNLGRVLSPRQAMACSAKLDASPVTDAYRSLVEQTSAMELARTQRSESRRQAAAALRAGAENLSPALVAEQKALLRLQALRNEVAIFQQHLDPFVFEMRSAREHEVRSSVYRHFTRLRAIQDLGVPIYGIGEYAHAPTDRVLVPRAVHRVYRRVRRRDAMHFIDTDLIPRPAAGRRAAGGRKEEGALAAQSNGSAS